MEKAKGPISKDFPPLRLYKDELQELMDFLSLHCQSAIVLETCGYKLESLDELSRLPVESTNIFFISSQNPYFQLRLTRTHGELYIGDSSIESEGLASHIENILLRGKIQYPHLLDKPWVMYLLSLPFFIGIIESNKYLIAICTLLFLCLIIGVVWEYRFSTKRYNTIIFKNRKDAPGFLIRKKDEIIMLVIGAVIGAVITVLVGLVIK